MQETVVRFAEWVADTPLSQLIQNELWAIPATQTIHILSVAIVLSAAAMLNFKLLGFAGKDQSLDAIARRFLPSAWIALVVLAVTGLTLIIAEPARSLLAGPFQLKMILLLAAIILTVVFQRIVSNNAERWDIPGSPVPAARILALTSLVLWMAIIVAGRWIAYAEL